MKGWWKVFWVLAAVMGTAAVVLLLPSFSALDFTNVKFTWRTTSSEKKTEIADFSEEPEISPSRSQFLGEVRAIEYLNYATHDYYHGSYEDAIRRLDRAKGFDPANYSVLKLSGQIFFEKSRYRKAYDDWARATQLPNDDQAIIRDLDVVKRLIRYCRNEMDRLQKSIHQNPADMISKAKLKELEERME